MRCACNDRPAIVGRPPMVHASASVAIFTSPLRVCSGHHWLALHVKSPESFAGRFAQFKAHCCNVLRQALWLHIQLSLIGLAGFSARPTINHGKHAKWG